MIAKSKAQLYLEQLRDCEQAADRITNMIENYKSELNRLREIENALTERMEQRKQIYIQTYQDIFTQIENVENEQERQLLEMRYIQGEEWQTIADNLYLGIAQTFRLHNKAMEHIKVPDTDISEDIEQYGSSGTLER